MPETCSICRQPLVNTTIISGADDSILIRCFVCGIYVITRTANEPTLIEHHARDGKHFLSCATRLATERGKRIGSDLHCPVHINTQNIKEIIKRTESENYGIASQIENFLLFLGESQKSIGTYVPFNVDQDYPLIAGRSGNDFEVLLKHLIDGGELETVRSQNGNYSINRNQSTNIRLSIKGFERINELKKKRTKEIAFVAMWFDPTMITIYENAIMPAIESSTTLKAVRIDLVQHNGEITDKIIGEIRRSAFVVADFTNNRGGVYYEAGFARGLGIEVIHTCKNDPTEIQNLHFDTNHRNHILWDNENDLKEKLTNRIKATIPGEYIR